MTDKAKNEYLKRILLNIIDSYLNLLDSIKDEYAIKKSKSKLIEIKLDIEQLN